MSSRYYLESPPSGDRALVSGSEAHHLLHVMRARVGDEVTLFDGSGWQFAAVIDRVGRAEVGCQIVAREQVDRETPFELTLAVALPKGDRQQWLVEKAVELGVTRLLPLKTARGVAQPADNALARLRRGVIEASKQCGRNRLMEIAAPVAWQELVDAKLSGWRLLAHPGCASLSAILGDWRSTEQHDGSACFIAVGPEGGFTDEEVDIAVAAGWRSVDLGPRILRIETAAIALASWLMFARP